MQNPAPPASLIERLCARLRAHFARIATHNGNIPPKRNPTPPSVSGGGDAPIVLVFDSDADPSARDYNRARFEPMTGADTITGSDTIELCAERKGMYFPIYKLDVKRLQEKGWSNKFYLGYRGQISQLNICDPSGCVFETPQVASPVQETKPVTGGSPGRGNLNDVVNVTVFFATGHSKVVSGITPPQSGNSNPAHPEATC